MKERIFVSFASIYLFIYYYDRSFLDELLKFHCVREGIIFLFCNNKNIFSGQVCSYKIKYSFERIIFEFISTFVLNVENTKKNIQIQKKPFQNILEYSNNIIF